jgi:uncharacterized RDD family membrane protein YckC
MAHDAVDALRLVAASGDARIERLFRRPRAARATSAAPRVDATAQRQPAGFISRLVGLVTDLVIVTLGSVVLGAVISLILGFFGLGAQQLNPGSQNQLLQLIRVLTVTLSALAVVLFVPMYFIVFWRLSGATPGKMLMGLRVIHGGDSNIGVARGIVRYFGYFLSALVLFLGFLWVLGDSHRQGWHDKMARTQVVYT